MKKPAANGDARRRLPSWIEAFVEQTANTHSPLIFRKWTGICTIAAALEQKVWLTTSSPLHPNLYVFLIGHPGAGKTRIIRAGLHYVSTIPDVNVAPVSMTWASLVDRLKNSKRVISCRGFEMAYNSMVVWPDELGTFIHKYDDEMSSGLSALYDVTPYTHTRRTNSIDIAINKPQLNILAGSTPRNLLDVMPERAWGQGFTSRLIAVYSDEKIIGDDFAQLAVEHNADLEHDMLAICGLLGQFKVTEDYRQCVNNWKELGEGPVPSHPKLLYYIERRRVNLYKLSMIAAIDGGDELILTRADFNRAMNWLLEAEAVMPDIFKAGAANADALAMDEIKHFVMINDKGDGVSEQRIVHFARERIPLNSVLKVIDVLVGSGMIRCVKRAPRTGIRHFSISQPPLDQ